MELNGTEIKKFPPPTRVNPLPLRGRVRVGVNLPTNDTPPCQTPTPPPTPENLDAIGCSEGCAIDFPGLNLIDWVQKPQISEDGRSSIIAQIDDRYDLTSPGVGGGMAKVIFSVGLNLYGVIVPQKQPHHPTPTTNQSPSPTTNQSPSPTTNQSPSPTTNQSPSPTTNQSPSPNNQPIPSP